MSFTYDVDVNDLFIKSADENAPPKVNRTIVRELANKTHAYIGSVEESGGNKHAAEIDVQDATVDLLTRIMGSEFHPHVTDFSSALTNEKVALALFDMDKSSKAHEEKLIKIQQDAQQQANNYTVLSWVIALAAVVIFAVFLFS